MQRHANASLVHQPSPKAHAVIRPAKPQEGRAREEEGVRISRDRAMSSLRHDQLRQLQLQLQLDSCTIRHTHPSLAPCSYKRRKRTAADLVHQVVWRSLYVNPKDLQRMVDVGLAREQDSETLLDHHEALYMMP
jgi:hypothetical protein